MILVEKLEEQTNNLPWAHIIASREGSFDASLEPQLIAARQKYFFPDEQDGGLRNEASIM